MGNGDRYGCGSIFGNIGSPFSVQQPGGGSLPCPRQSGEQGKAMGTVEPIRGLPFDRRFQSHSGANLTRAGSSFPSSGEITSERSARYGTLAFITSSRPILIIHSLCGGPGVTASAGVEVSVGVSGRCQRCALIAEGVEIIIITRHIGFSIVDRRRPRNIFASRITPYK